jgi:hypothetical protein
MNFNKYDIISYSSSLECDIKNTFTDFFNNNLLHELECNKLFEEFWFTQAKALHWYNKNLAFKAKFNTDNGLFINKVNEFSLKSLTYFNEYILTKKSIKVKTDLELTKKLRSLIQDRKIGEFFYGLELINSILGQIR